MKMTKEIYQTLSTGLGVLEAEFYGTQTENSDESVKKFEDEIAYARMLIEQLKQESAEIL